MFTILEYCGAVDSVNAEAIAEQQRSMGMNKGIVNIC
jgi:hypothetical protein